MKLLSLSPRSVFETGLNQQEAGSRDSGGRDGYVRSGVSSTIVDPNVIIV